MGILNNCNVYILSPFQYAMLSFISPYFFYFLCIALFAWLFDLSLFLTTILSANLNFYIHLPLNHGKQLSEAPLYQWKCSNSRNTLHAGSEKEDVFCLPTGTCNKKMSSIIQTGFAYSYWEMT